MSKPIELPHHAVLKDCLQFLTSSLRHDKKLLADLQNEEILTQDSVDQILEYQEDTVTEGSRKLVQVLLHDPSEENFHRFLKILTQNSQEEISEKLVEKYKEHYEPWRDVQEPLTGILLKTERLFVESVREKYKSLYQFIPRKSWINKDFMEMDKLYVNLELFMKDRPMIYYEHYSDFITDKSIKSNRYVINGGSGAGKTTLTRKIAFDWSMGRLKQYVCVLLIKAREVQSDVNVCQYVTQKYVSHEKYSESVCKSVSNLIESGRVLILIDGFDEFKHYKDQSNEIMKLINGTMYSSTPVITTTRHHYITHLEHNPITAIATFIIYSIHPGNIEHYIKLYFNGDRLKSANQIDNIVSDIIDGIGKMNMWGVVRTPIVCFLICLLYEQLEALPSQQADVYIQLMAAFKKMYQGKVTGNRVSDRDWEGILPNVGELSLDMLLSEKGGRLVFSHDEVSKYIHLEVACKTGLINLTDPAPSQEVTGLIDDCDVKWYQFLHKSVQEFCAAHYIHQSGERGVEKVKCFIKDKETFESVREVIEFSVKLSSGDSDHSAIDVLLSHVVCVLNSDETLASITLIVNDPYINLWCDQMRWLHEAGITHKHVSKIKVLYLDTYYCEGRSVDHFGRYISGLMKHHNVTQVSHIPDTPLRFVNLCLLFTPKTDQMTSLCSVISVSRDLKYLLGEDISVPDLGLWLDPDKNPHLEVIHLPRCKLSSPSMYNDISNLHKWTHLKKVDLSFSKLDQHTVDHVDIPQCRESLKSLTHINFNDCSVTPVLPLVSHVISLCTNLRVLNLRFNTIDLETPDSQSQHFTRNIFTSITNNIEVLILEFCHMKTVTLRSLCQCLPNWTQLRELNLSNNDLSEVGHELVQSMPVSIQNLNLYSCKLTKGECSVLSECLLSHLPNWTQLCNLSLSNNDLSEVGPVLIKTLPVSIQKLNLYTCNLSSEACTLLSQCLSTWHSLQTLYLSFTSLSGQCTHIVQSLPQSIEELYLNHCKLTSDDMCTVARQLPHLSHLKQVNLSYNPQTDMRVWEVFVECLPHCRSGLKLWLVRCDIDKNTEKRLTQSNIRVNIKYVYMR